MRSYPRRIRTKLEAGERAYGVVVQLASPDVVDIAGNTGYDYVWLDCEHGTLSISDVNTMIRAADAAGIDIVVRAPDHSQAFIQSALDAGATGIMVPHVKSVEIAQAIVAAAKYAPAGNRGACPYTRAVGHLSEDWVADYERADRDTLVFALIEDIDGVEDVDAIAKVPGLDGLLVGPFDLSMSLGHKGSMDHPDIEAAVAKVVHATHEAGIEYVSILGFGPGSLESVTASGSRIVNVTDDRWVLYATFQSQLKEVRAGLGSTVAEAR